MVVQFPDPESADPSGLLCVGGDLNSESLLAAYTRGIFPWPHPGYPLLWFSPPERGIIQFQNLHIPQSLKKIIKKSRYEFSFDRAFAEVMDQCAQVPRPGQDGTWITDEMKLAYLDFHQRGHAHSVECWREGDLVGGLYGVWVGGAFVGESMFFKADNASKLCLLYLIEFLRAHGHKWMDVQMVTPVVEALGGGYVPRSEFLNLWRAGLQTHPFPTLTF